MSSSVSPKICLLSDSAGVTLSAMSDPTQNRYAAARQKLHDAVAAAAEGLSLGERLELVSGAEYAIAELAGDLPAPNDHDREVMGPLFFRGRELVLATPLA